MTDQSGVGEGSGFGVGILGVGIAGRVLARAFQAAGGSVVAFCGRTPERAARIAERFGADLESDPARLAERPDVDLVAVATPPAQHLEGVEVAVQAGKAVLCEKPFALNAGQARAMRDMAVAARVPHFANFEFRRFGPRARLRRLIAEGYVGNVRDVFLVGSSNYLAMTGEYLPRWHVEPGAGGGWLGASASHDVDCLRSMIGEITEVSANLPNHVPAFRLRGEPEPVASRVDDAAYVLLRFASGASGLIANTAAACTPTFGSRIEVYGDAGTLVLVTRTLAGGPLAQGTVLFGQAAGASDLIKLDTGPSDDVDADADPHHGPAVQWAQDVVAAVRTGATGVTPNFEDGYRNQLVLDAARRSHADRRWVEIHDGEG